MEHLEASLQDSLLLHLRLISEDATFSAAEKVLQEEALENGRSRWSDALPLHNRIDQINDILTIHVSGFDSLPSTSIFHTHITVKLLS